MFFCEEGAVVFPHPFLRQANVIVFTDGRPLSYRKTWMASYSVRKVARLMWVPVTRYAPLKRIKRWVTLPNSTRPYRKVHHRNSSKTNVRCFVCSLTYPFDLGPSWFPFACTHIYNIYIYIYIYVYMASAQQWSQNPRAFYTGTSRNTLEMY